MFSATLRILATGATLYLTLLPAVSDAAVVSQKNVEINGGNCIVVIQTDEASDSTTVNNMTCPQEASRAYAIRYIWLNSSQVSFLLARYSDANLAPILGEHPVVMLNPVYDNLNSIYKKYGSRFSELTEMDFPNQFTFKGKNKSTDDGNEAIPFKMSYKDIPIALRRNFLFSQFESKIVWPDSNLINSIQSNTWPQTYKYAYSLPDGERASFLRDIERSARLKHAELTDNVAECMLYYKLLSKENFDGYWDRIDRLERAISDHTIETWQVDEGSDDPEGTVDIVQEASNNPTYDFYAEVTKEYWPADFLVMSGQMSSGSDEAGCEVVGGGLSTSVDPRALAVLVAVVTPVNDRIVVRSAKLAHDDRTLLRQTLSFAPEMSDAMLSDLELSKQNGKSLVIPLHMELRYDKDDFPLSEISQGQSDNPIFKIFQKYPDASVNFRRCEDSGEINDNGEARITCKSFMRQKLATFPSPEATAVTSSYFFGPAFQLKTLEIDGKIVEVRDPPEFGLVADHMGEYGSCPFAYFETADGKSLYHGRILVGANSVTRSATDTIAIPPGATKLVIKEVEPEITFLHDITFTSDKNVLRDVSFSRPAKVSPRDQLSINIPSGSISVAITGYYELLSRVERNSIP
ncbi:hypothetical protein [Rhizobium leguminosarum]|uniref:hypothetical protein n=1 Tax=Rhizobium leguminosarum TaxID=384 RepID=UPI003F9B2DC6